MGYVLESRKEQVTSTYGNRPQFGDFHTGIDLVKQPYQIDNIIAFTKGKVVAVRKGCHEKTPSEGYGNYIKLQHGNGYETLYCHLKDVLVKVGDVVSEGQLIGSMGQTGWSTGYHLHFEVRINGNHTNPAPYLQGQAIPAYEEPRPQYTPGMYQTLYKMKVRDGVWGRVKSKKELSVDGQKHSDTNGAYLAGINFTALEIINANDGSVWAKGYSGYVCIKDSKQEYCKKI